jgi:hypothetical protein
MTLLFQHFNIVLKLIATETFQSFAKYQVDHSPAAGRSKLDLFIEPLLQLCAYDSPNRDERVRVRQAGFNALIRMIDYNHDAPSNFHLIIPRVLDNMSDGVRIVNIAPVEASAEECLKRICRWATMANLSSHILTPIFDYLDSYYWKNVPFAVNVLRFVAEQSKAKLKNAQLLLLNLLNHMETFESPAALLLLLRFRIFSLTLL